MKFLKGILSICILFSSFLALSQSNTVYSKLKIHLHEVDLQEVSKLGLETDHGCHAHHKHLINVFNQYERGLLDQAGIPYDVVIEDVNAFYNQYGTSDENYVMAQSRGVDCVSSETDKFDYPTPDNYSYGSMGGYLTYQEALDELDKMAELYPNLITERQAIGNIQTQEGRNLYYLVISSTPNNVDPSKPQILYNALHHAREPNSLSQLIFYMWYLLEGYGNDDEVTYLVDNTSMFFVPIVNPDGYVFNETNNPNGGGFWRKNRYVNPNGEAVGVDLNRNYGYFWGFDNNGSSGNENSDVYRGPSAFSEPETQAIRELCIANNFQIALNYHTFGNLLIHPWGYSDQPTDEDDVFKSLARVMTADNDFQIGTGTETVGYVVNGDSDDWLYGEETEKNKIYSMTPEVGPAFWPAEDQIDRLNKTAVRHNLNAAHLLYNFAWAKEISPKNEITEKNGSFKFNLEKSGLKEGDISFALYSNTPGLELTMNEYPNLMMDIGDMMELEIDYIIDPVVIGDELSMTMSIDNGLFNLELPLIKTYNASVSDPDIVETDNLDETTNFEIVGNWNLTEEDFVSAPYSITDSPNQEYPNNSYSEITLESIDLSTADSAYFKFQTKFEIEIDYDFAQILVSTDGTIFEPVCGKFTNPAVPDQLPEDEPVYDGFQSEWVQEEICLNEFVGNENVTIRFTMSSDQFVREDGFYFDDLTVEQFTGSTSTTDDLALENILIAPNPVKDLLQIKIKSSENKAQSYSYQILNVEGRSVKESILGSSINLISTEDLPEGFYSVCILKGGRILSTSKLVKI